MRIKSNRWLDGRQQDLWPDRIDHINWVVQTAGPVNLDLEDRTVMFNSGKTRTLPSGFPMILKSVEDGMAYCYNDHEGVIRVPVELLVPVGK